VFQVVVEGEGLGGEGFRAGRALEALDPTKGFGNIEAFWFCPGQFGRTVMPCTVGIGAEGK
jgi:hypothetical protein